MNVPCIEIVDGRPAHAIRERETAVDMAEITSLAESLSRVGEIALIDGNAEQDTGDNLAILKSVCNRFPCRVGGGMRSQDRGRALLRAGAERIIISSDADAALLRSFRPVHLILEIDLAAIPDVAGRIKLTETFCWGYLFKNVPTDASTGGIDLEEVRRLSLMTERRLCVATDEITVEQVASLDRIGVDVQVGEALHSERIGNAESFASCIHWDEKGLAPTVVQDTSGQVLMLTVSNRESLEKSLRSGEGTYFDRSRGIVWRKGERTGHDQLVLRCLPSCDRKALHFLVRQAGFACEKGTYSCFGEREFGLDFLSEITAAKRSGDPESSHTARLLSDPDVLEARIREKVDEVSRARKREETLWAIADLVHFLVVKAVSGGLSWGEVVRELRGRQR